MSGCQLQRTKVEPLSAQSVSPFHPTAHIVVLVVLLLLLTLNIAMCCCFPALVDGHRGEVEGLAAVAHVFHARAQQRDTPPCRLPVPRCGAPWRTASAVRWRATARSWRASRLSWLPGRRR